MLTCAPPKPLLTIDRCACNRHNKDGTLRRHVYTKASQLSPEAAAPTSPSSSSGGGGGGGRAGGGSGGGAVGPHGYENVKPKGNGSGSGGSFGPHGYENVKPGSGGGAGSSGGAGSVAVGTAPLACEYADADKQYAGKGDFDGSDCHGDVVGGGDAHEYENKPAMQLHALGLQAGSLNIETGTVYSELVSSTGPVMRSGGGGGGSGVGAGQTQSRAPLENLSQGVDETLPHFPPGLAASGMSSAGNMSATDDAGATGAGAEDAEYVAPADAAGAEDAPVYALPVDESFAGFGDEDGFSDYSTDGSIDI